MPLSCTSTVHQISVVALVAAPTMLACTSTVDCDGESWNLRGMWRADLGKEPGKTPGLLQPKWIQQSFRCTAGAICRITLQSTR